jgi:hypothetical protein
VRRPGDPASCRPAACPCARACPLALRATDASPVWPAPRNTTQRRSGPARWPAWGATAAAYFAARGPPRRGRPPASGAVAGATQRAFSAADVLPASVALSTPAAAAPSAAGALLAASGAARAAPPPPLPHGARRGSAGSAAPPVRRPSLLRAHSGPGGGAFAGAGAGGRAVACGSKAMRSPCDTTSALAARIGTARCPPRNSTSARVVTPRLMPQFRWTQARLLTCAALAGFLGSC